MFTEILISLRSLCVLLLNFCQNEGCQCARKNYARENQRKEYLWLKRHNHALLV